MDKADFIFSIPELIKYLSDSGRLSKKLASELGTLENQKFFLMIPKYYIDLIDWTNSEDPLRKMVLFSNLESHIREYETEDPIGDMVRTKVPGIIHRYPDRCLLLLTNACAVHCRFCFRKGLLKNSVYSLSQSIEYIRSHEELWEVILSGGDPFTMTDAFLSHVLKKLRAIPHVKMIRFHTRTPVVYPKRVSGTLVTLIGSAKPVSVVVHINHPKEITPQFISGIQMLKNAGIMLLSQTVLLKGVNTNKEILTTLFRRLFEIGVKPYYLHHLDKALGTHHFRISVEDGKRLFRSMRGNVSGVCLPEYVIDIPGGFGKIPVFWLVHAGAHTYDALSFDNTSIRYTDYGTMK